MYFFAISYIVTLPISFIVNSFQPVLSTPVRRPWQRIAKFLLKGGQCSEFRILTSFSDGWNTSLRPWQIKPLQDSCPEYPENRILIFKPWIKALPLSYVAIWSLAKPNQLFWSIFVAILNLLILALSFPYLIQ